MDYKEIFSKRVDFVYPGEKTEIIGIYSNVWQEYNYFR